MRNFYRKMPRALLIFCAILFSLSAYAQERTVSGTVTSADDAEGLPGVNVLIQGTGQGTVTDINGQFRLQVPGDDAVLVFSFVGFETQEIAVGSRSVIDVQMSSEATALSEVVVVGYGTTTKQEITSSVVSVKEEDFNKGNVNDAANLLQGKVPGLSIADPGSDPNSEPKIRLRGISSFGPNSSPLIIIDGVISQDLNQVDPADIAAMDVLKDAAASAIYGTRAGAGVIIVTTKSGREGRAEVDYNGYVAFENRAKTVDVLSADEYRNFPVAGNDLGASTDWFDEISQGGFTSVHNLSLGGGTAKTSYRVSFNLRDNQGIQKGTGFNQINSRVNLSQKAINDIFTFNFNFYQTRRDSEFGFQEAWRYATIYNPTSPVKNPDGSFAETVLFDYFNPLALIEQNINEGNRKQLNFNIGTDIRLIPKSEELILSAQFSEQINSELNGEYYSKDAFFRGQNRNGLARRFTNDRTDQIFETTLNYNHDFSGFNFKALAGYTWQELIREGMFAEGGNFVSDAFTYNNLSAALDFDNGIGNVSSYKNKTNLVAFFGRVNFNFDNKYFLMASYRYEGSSRFGEDNKWGGFPAVSGGVEFANIFDMGNIQQLKLRLSYGQTGTLPTESYLSLARLGPSGNFFNPSSGAFTPGFAPVSNPNPELKWEVKSELNFGLDFTFANYRWSGSIDVYSRVTDDLIDLVNVPVPPNLFPQTWLNVGKLTNNGLELALRWVAVQKQNVYYETGINFTTYNTNLDKYGDRQLIANLGAPGQNGTFVIELKEGNPLGNIWGPTIDENDPVAEDGSWNLIDKDGNGSVGSEDDSVIGNGLPDYELGWNNTITAGNWDINVFFRGSFGHSLVNTFRAFYENPNVIANYNILSTSSNLVGLNGATNIFSSYHVENAGFFKLDNMTVGYSFNMPDGSAFRKIRAYAAGQNLFVISGYNGVDPEVRYDDPGDADNGGRPSNENNPSPLAPGIDRRDTWFRTYTITLGLQLGF